jgi:hypothetical protein
MSSGGGDAQPRSFAPRSATPADFAAPMAESERYEPTEMSGMQNRAGSLSILA